MKKIFFGEYIRNKYGKSLYRIPIDLPFSCPHRISGGGRGCTFCPEDGARARHLRSSLDIGRQVDEGISYVKRRYGSKCGFIAYFQSFTGTNAPVEKLKEYHSAVLSRAEFPMVIIATRPDCLDDAVLDYLEELNSDYDLWIELGVQTANNDTLRHINRQHDFECVRTAVANLAERGIRTAAHVILGLPGEGLCEFRRTAQALAELPFSAVKIHNLLILKNTPLAAEYAEQLKRGKNNTRDAQPLICPMNEYEYAEALIDFLKYIPDEWPLMRLTADAEPSDIIAPEWWMKKGQFIEYVRNLLDRQGAEVSAMPVVKTADGSYTLYQPEYRQHFHSTAGARSEARRKFIEPAGIADKLAAGKRLTVLDVGFGLGVNALELAGTAEATAGGQLEIISLEKDIRAVKAALDMARQTGMSDNVEILDSLLKNGKWDSRYVSILLLTGDARQTLQGLGIEADAVFLDPFSHEVNPELWSYDYIKLITANLAKNGIILTYSSAFPVRGAMQRCGLNIYETLPFGRKKGGTAASFESDLSLSPLSEKEYNIITKSTAGLSYRDPNLNWNRTKIREFRRKTVRYLQKHSIPKWYK